MEENAPLIFTRYLYSKEDVMHSLFLSILNKNKDEALFWAYELYYSGFELEVMNFVFHVFNHIYEKCCPVHFTQFINNQYHSWYENYEKSVINDTILGTMVWNLLQYDYELTQFLDDYFQIKRNILRRPVSTKRRLRLIMVERDIEKYKTVVSETVQSWLILRRVYNYSAHKEYNELFKTTNMDFKKDYLEHWLYYASFSPIWMNRLIEYDAVIDHETKSVSFQDEEKEELFYSLYNYEPDEQPAEICEKSIGNGNEIQLSIDDFIKQFCK
jgi:hypothetical protein